MERFLSLSSQAIVYPRANVDTDQILPSRFLKKDRDKNNYGDYLFHDLRYTPAEVEQACVFNNSQSRSSRILLTGRNFGCGSSREGAVYALYDYGIRAIIAPSFGDIFYSNSLKNGLLPVRLDEGEVQLLEEQLDKSQGNGILTVDLMRQVVVDLDHKEHSFEVEPFWRECLMQGIDDLELTLQQAGKIRDFEAAYLVRYPWMDRSLTKVDRE